MEFRDLITTAKVEHWKFILLSVLKKKINDIRSFCLMLANDWIRVDSSFFKASNFNLRRQLFLSI